MHILAINVGSSSVRIAAFSGANDELARAWEFHEADATQDPERVLSRALAAHDAPRFDAVVHRLVHGGDIVTAPGIVDAALRQALQTVVPLAPLHNGACLAWIEASARLLGGDPVQIVVPDTAFFRNLPERVRRYALPTSLCDELGIHRFGFHGLAHQSMLETWQGMRGHRDKARLITLQLGSGCSIAATMGSTAIDTSMGFSPLEGLVMATRPGDVDPGVLLHVMRRKGWNADTIESVLNHDSGLKGISGFSGDMRTLLASTEPQARLAVDLYCYRARKYVGAYLAALGGADAILFGGGVGENCPEIRERILSGMEWCGIAIDSAANASTAALPRKVSTSVSATEIWIAPPDEARVMARAALVSWFRSSLDFDIERLANFET